MTLAEIDTVTWSRLKWRCRRGLLELDLVLQAFLQEEYEALSEQERQHLDQLLDLPDDTLLAYLQKRQHPDNPDIKQILKKII